MGANALFRIPIIKDDTIRLVCTIVNIFLPGVGTLIGGCIDGSDVNVIICGVLQMVASAFFVGCIWSWVWAYFIYTKTQVCK